MTTVTTDRRRGVNSGAAIKTPVRVATTTNITLSGLQTIDGVTVVDDDRVLVKNQTTASENGIWVADSGDWTRALDFDGAYDVVTGTMVLVNDGSSNSDTSWRVTTSGAITIGATSLSFEEAVFSDSSSMSFLASGAGAVARTAQAKAREVLSVTDFGAVGDGTTDDTTAIAAALAAGRVVVFPDTGSGYKISDVLAPLANSHIIGHGYGSRIIQSSTTANAFTNINDSVTFEGLWIVGQNTDVTAIGIKCVGADRPTVRNCVFQDWMVGIWMDNCNDYRVEGNLLYGGTYDGSSSCDIRCNSSTSAVSGGKITGNCCYSNNDLAIYCDANAYDSDVIISGNHIQPRQSDGLTLIADANNRRRNGIAVQYNGTNETRMLISDNNVRDVSYAGIYEGGATQPNGPVIISNNIVYRSGWGTAYPADASLRAGILCLSNGNGDIVSENVVDSCETAGIKFAGDDDIATNTMRVLCRGNTITDCVGTGILTSNKPHHLVIEGNMVLRASTYAIHTNMQNSTANVGSIHIKNNYVTKSGATGGIVADGVYSTTYQMSVCGNVVLGDDNATADSFNSGIYVRGNVMIDGNRVQDVRTGIIRADSTTTRDTTWHCKNNMLVSCATVGINGGTSGDGVLIASNNTFDNCGSRVTLCREGNISGDRIETQATAVPTTGTWAVGDIVWHSDVTVGSPIGWICSTAGASGVFAFTAMANL